jgi:hypothetical protein
MESKVKQIIRLRVIKSESGKDEVEVLLKGNQEELENLIFSVMMNDNVLRNAVVGAMNAYAYKLIEEDRKARLN